jgi:hypothetical protein
MSSDTSSTKQPENFTGIVPGNPPGNTLIIAPQPSNNQPTTHLLKMGFYNTIAIWNKANAFVKPVIRTATIRNVLTKMLEEDLGNYKLTSAAKETIFAPARGTTSLFENIFGKLSGGIKKSRRGRSNGRRGRTRKTR